METIPAFILILFAVTTVFTIWQFYSASGKSTAVLITVCGWTLLQGILGLTGFYQNNQAMPPRFVLLLGPALIFIAILFFTRRGRVLVDSFDIGKLTFLSVVRIPVELTLYYVFIAGLIPESMTFEGRNFDIISGLTAPVIYYVVFVSKKASHTMLLVWNLLCLGLLLNIVTIAILSAQTPFQKLAFDQPNIGITYFPFVWLPSVIVPIVLFSHLTSIRRLLTSFPAKQKIQVGN